MCVCVYGTIALARQLSNFVLVSWNRVFVVTFDGREPFSGTFNIYALSRPQLHLQPSESGTCNIYIPPCTLKIHGPRFF